MGDLVRWDPFEREEMRARQVMYLGRYGRQPVTQWADMDVDELGLHFRVLTDIVREEGSLKRGLEDL